MDLKRKMEAENGLLEYCGILRIIIPKLTQRGLIREFYNPAGKGMLKTFQRCESKKGKGIYKHILQLTGFEYLIDKFCTIEKNNREKNSALQRNGNECTVIEQFICRSVKRDFQTFKGLDYPRLDYYFAINCCELHECK